ncbi:MAG: cytidine deaminase [Planctomycetaceae bacterium]|nr:cytidine deaminase [Planctomycetaceae bacterium]
MTASERSDLIHHACEARQHAHAPYSKFLVGAALLTESSEIIRGCNVENASYGLTICAERVAFGTAIAAGHRRFQALAIATSGGHPPCGACRQFAAEFCESLSILLIDTDHPDRVIESNLCDLLPGRFKLTQ